MNAAANPDATLITGRCPMGCRGPTLYVDARGLIRCGDLVCPRPLAVHEMLAGGLSEAEFVMPEKCPKCGSPDPERHPAVQFEGEVQPCNHPWHGPHVGDGLSPAWWSIRAWASEEALRLSDARLRRLREQNEWLHGELRRSDDMALALGGAVAVGVGSTIGLLLRRRS